MSRLPLADPEQLPSFLRTLHDESGDNTPLLPNIARIFAPAPDLLESFIAWYFPWHMNDGVQARLPVRVKELVRLRLATFSGCRACKSARMAEDLIPEAQAVGVDGDVAQFSAAEQTALAFAEKFALDHYSIDDTDFALLREHYDDAQILELVVLTGVIYLGFGRALSVLQLENVTCALPPNPGNGALTNP
jgi:alkylhydroperoxidase family enzyme